MIKKVKTLELFFNCNHSPHHTQQEKTRKNKKITLTWDHKLHYTWPIKEKPKWKRKGKKKLTCACNTYTQETFETPKRINLTYNCKHLITILFLTFKKQYFKAWLKNDFIFSMCIVQPYKNEWMNFFYYNLKKITLIWKIILKFIYCQRGTLKIWIAILFFACDYKENVFKIFFLTYNYAISQVTKEVKYHGKFFFTILYIKATVFVCVFVCVSSA